MEEEKPIIKEEPKEEDLISQAEKTAERLENANSRLNYLLDRQERLKVRDTLGGTTEAGKQEKTKEELEKEAAQKYVQGTGYEDIFQ